MELPYITKFKVYGCPKCGAVHKYGHLAGYTECYRCWYVFDPATNNKTRLYLNDLYQKVEPLCNDFEKNYYKIKLRVDLWFKKSYHNRYK